LAFLCLDWKPEVFYGGAAGGGKSDALLMGALQYVDVPGYHALILRRTFAELSLPEALMERANEWLGPTDAVWNSTNKRWTFPSGASLTFGYLKNMVDVGRYQSAAFHYVAYDELTHFTERMYTYIVGSRARRTKTMEEAGVPIRARSASNPGNIGHEWVRRRFVDEPRDADRSYIPATIDDNPYLDKETYTAQMMRTLDPLTIAQLLRGDWTARLDGTKFKREWFKIVEKDAVPKDLTLTRYWDMAATDPAPDKDPDWTCGVLMGRSSDGFIYVLDIRRMQGSPGATEKLIKFTAELDGKNVSVRMEQEPGASGIIAIDHYSRGIMAPYDFLGDPPTGNKEVRANPFSSQCQQGNVYLVRGPWVDDFLNEAEAFPNGEHDDMVDGCSGAYADLTYKGRAGLSFL